MSEKNIRWILIFLNVTTLTLGILWAIHQQEKITAMNGLFLQYKDVMWQKAFTEASETAQALALLKSSHDQEAVKFLNKRLKLKVDILESHKGEMTTEQTSLFESLRNTANE